MRSKCIRESYIAKISWVFMTNVLVSSLVSTERLREAMQNLAREIKDYQLHGHVREVCLLRARHFYILYAL